MAAEIIQNVFHIIFLYSREVFSPSLADKRLSSALPETLPALRHMPCVGEVQQSMTVARQTIEMIITFRKSNKTD